MDEKQIYWIYNELKSVIQDTQGQPLTWEITSRLYDKLEKIINVTKKSRELDPEMDEEITGVLGFFFKLVASAETLNKPL